MLKEGIINFLKMKKTAGKNLRLHKKEMYQIFKKVKIIGKTQKIL